MTDLYDYQQPYAKDPAAVADWRAEDGTLGLQEVIDHLHPTMLVGTSGVTGAFNEKAIRSMHEHCDAADHPADVQPHGAGRTDPGEPARLDRRRGPGRHRQPVRTGRARRHDVPHRPGEQRADVPRPGSRRDRLPGRDDAAVVVHRGGPRPGQAGGPVRSREGAAAGHRPAPRGLGHRGRGRHQCREGGRHRAGRGRRPDRGGPRSDVAARVPADHALP